METNRKWQLAVAVLVGVICVLAIERLPGLNSVSASTNKPSETVSSSNYIAIGAVSKTDQNFFWLMDSQNKKLFIYEYINEQAIKFKAARDIQYDLDIPPGSMFPWNSTVAGYSPQEIADIYKSIRDQQRKAQEKPNK